MNVRIRPEATPSQTHLYTARSLEVLDDMVVLVMMSRAKVVFDKEDIRELLVDHDPGDWW